MSSKPNPTIGHRYNMGEHMVLCHGPIDYISRIEVDNRVAWEGKTTGGTIHIDAEDLFGGKESEGGVGGFVDIMMGRPTQTKNTYLKAMLGSTIPAFRGVVSAVLKRAYVGNTKYPKPWKFRATRTSVREKGVEQWYAGKAAIDAIGATTTVLVEDLALHGENNVGLDNALVVGGLDPADTLLITKPLGLTYQAWSRYPSDGADETEFYRNWLVGVSVTYDDGTTSTFKDQDYYATPSLAELAFEPFRVTGSTSYRFWLPDTFLENRGGLSLRVSKIGGHTDMNPAHIIRECITSTQYGLGHPDADLDDVSFMASADTLFNEGMGISLLWEMESPVEEFIAEVCRHIDAAHYVDLITGKFVLKLIRDDYDIESLPVLDASNITRVISAACTPSNELVNTVTVAYWSAKTGKDASVQVSDPAAVQRQGRIISTTMQYPGFTQDSLAIRAAQRDLKALSNPMYTFEIAVNRIADGLNIGSPFILDLPEHRVYNLVMRVADIKIGDGRRNEIHVTCTQDHYSLPDIPVMAPTPGWENPAPAPAASPARLVFELPYFELVKQGGQAETDSALAADPTVGYLGVAAVKPSGNSTSAELVIDVGAGFTSIGTMDFCAFATLADVVNRDQPNIPIEPADLALVAQGSIAQIGSELVSVDDIDFTVDPIEVTVTRGVLDTVPQEHVAGATVFFWEDYIGSDSVEYAENEQIDVRVLPITGAGVLALDKAPTDSMVMAARAIRPYPPANVQINGSYFPSEIVSETLEISVTYATRNRFQQTGGTHLGFYEGDIASEDGVEYSLRFLSLPSMDIVYAQDNIVAGIHEFTPAAVGDVRLQLWSVRNGDESYQTLEHDFVLAYPPPAAEPDPVVTQDIRLMSDGVSPGVVLSNDNRTFTSGPGAGGVWHKAKGHFTRSATDSYYFEMTIDSFEPAGATSAFWIGIAVAGTSTASGSGSAATDAGNGGRYQYAGNGQISADGVAQNYGATWSAGDTLGVSIAPLAGDTELRFYKNGLDQGVAYTIPGLGNFEPHFCAFGGSTAVQAFTLPAVIQYLPAGFVPWLPAPTAVSPIFPMTTDGTYLLGKVMVQVPTADGSISETRLAYSADGGETWEWSDEDIGFNANQMAYGNGLIVASVNSWVGVTSSIDGIWATQQLINDFSLYGICGIVFNGAKFVIAGQSGKILESVDGETWTNIPTNLHMLGDFQKIRFGTGVYFALFANNLYKSIDLAAWSLNYENTNPDSLLMNVQFANNKLFIMGRKKIGLYDRPWLLVSEDSGTTWSDVSPVMTTDNGFPMHISDIAHISTNYVLLGDNFEAYSADLSTWTVKEPVGAQKLYSPAQQGIYLVALLATNLGSGSSTIEMVRTTDGATWVSTSGIDEAPDPADLFANSEAGFWYDPTDLGTLWQDVAGTIPVTADGDPVRLILDKSGNGNHFVVDGTGTVLPTYRTDGQTHWVQGEGGAGGTVDAAFLSCDLPVAVNWPMTVVAAAAVSADYTFYLSLSEPTHLTENNMLFVVGQYETYQPAVALYQDFDGFQAIGLSKTLPFTATMVAKFKDGEQSVTVDGASQSMNWQKPATAMNALTLGALRRRGVEFIHDFGSKMHGLIGRFDEMSDSEIALATSYLDQNI